MKADWYPARHCSHRTVIPLLQSSCTCLKVFQPKDCFSLKLVQYHFIIYKIYQFVWWKKRLNVTFLHSKSEATWTSRASDVQHHPRAARFNLTGAFVSETQTMVMLKVCSTYYTAVNHKDKGTWDVVLLANSVFALLFFSFKSMLFLYICILRLKGDRPLLPYQGICCVPNYVSSDLRRIRAGSHWLLGRTAPKKWSTWTFYVM